MNQVELSTITLNIYQRESIRREILANDKNIDAYEPGLGRKIVDSLKVGWHVLEAILLFILKIWAVILIALIVFIVYQKINKKG